LFPGKQTKTGTFYYAKNPCNQPKALLVKGLEAGNLRYPKNTGAAGFLWANCCLFPCKRGFFEAIPVTGKDEFGAVDGQLHANRPENVSNPICE
jgi:hypothetical protein